MGIFNSIKGFFGYHSSDEYLKTDETDRYRSKLTKRIEQHKGNPSLLVLSGLKLKQITPEIIRLINPDVTTINLSNNFLVVLPVELFKFTKLKTLCLVGNPLTDLPIDIINLKELKELSLDSHLFDKLPNEVKERLELQEWWVQSNDPFNDPFHSMNDGDFTVCLKHIVNSETKQYEVSVWKCRFETIENTEINTEINGEILIDNYDEALSLCLQLIQKSDISEKILDELGIDYTIGNEY